MAFIEGCPHVRGGLDEGCPHIRDSIHKGLHSITNLLFLGGGGGSRDAVVMFTLTGSGMRLVLAFRLRGGRLRKKQQKN